MKPIDKFSYYNKCKNNFNYGNNTYMDQTLLI